MEVSDALGTPPCPPARCTRAPVIYAHTSLAGELRVPVPEPVPAPPAAHTALPELLAGRRRPARIWSRVVLQLPD